LSRFAQILLPSVLLQVVFSHLLFASLSPRLFCQAVASMLRWVADGAERCGAGIEDSACFSRGSVSSTRQGKDLLDFDLNLRPPRASEAEVLEGDALLSQVVGQLGVDPDSLIIPPEFMDIAPHAFAQGGFAQVATLWGGGWERYLFERLLF
jgi:hypothetical protein